MNTTAIALASGGFLSVLVGWVTYMATIPKGNVPERPVGAILLTLGGAIVAIAGIVLGFQDGGSPGVAVVIPAAFALMMGPLFPFLLTLRKTPVGNIKVKIGDSLLPFSAQTSDGSAFHTDEFAGKRILLKFFRGNW